MFFTTVQCVTANHQPESLCALHLTMIRRGRLYKEKSWYFCPPDPMLTHSSLEDPSLTLGQLLDAPKLYEYWDEITSYLEGQLILFHQLPQNISALTKAISYYGLSTPHFTFSSTMMLAKRLYPMLPNCKIETICKELRLNSTPNIASQLPKQMADFVMTCSKQFHIDDEEALFTKAGICLGTFASDGICYPEFLSFYEPPKISAPTLCDPLEQNSLRNEVICLTGPLESMTRAMAVKRLTHLGAHFQSQVTPQTTLVVTNLYDTQTGQYKRLTSKLQKALILKGQGQKLTIIDEKIFLERLKLSSSS